MKPENGLMMKSMRFAVKGLTVIYVFAVIFFLLLYLLDIDYYSLVTQQIRWGNSYYLRDAVLGAKMLAVSLVSIGITLIYYFPIAKRLVITGSSLLILSAIFIIGYSDRIYDEQLSRIRFSEICSNNDGIKLEGADDYPDYIELYNDSEYEISLRDLRLQVNGRKEIPLNYSNIGSKSYLIVTAEEGGVSNSIDTNLGSDGLKLALLSPTGMLIDEVIVPKLEGNRVYANLNDPEYHWDITDPTPGLENSCSRPPEPVMSAESGFYDEEFYLEISASEGCEVYYTTDGSIPTKDSAKYNGPIKVRDRKSDPNVYRSIKNVIPLWNEPENIDKTDNSQVNKCTIIRAMACREGKFSSDIVTRSFFVDLSEYENTPVISLISDPDELFGDNGIYVTGKEYDDWYLGGQLGEAPSMSFEERREIEAYLDYYDGNQFVGQNVGLKIQGKSTRYRANKRFSIYARQEYSGSSILDYYYFGYPNHSLMLRADSADLICQDLIASANTAVGTLPGYRAAVFLDGEFWYWTFIRPKYSRQHISWEYGVAKDSVVFSPSNMPTDVYEFLDEHPDLSDMRNYSELCSIIDIDNYIDYMASNIYLCNMDMSEHKNFKAWKTDDISSSEFEDGKWRFLAYDMDCIVYAKVEGKEDLHKYMIDSFSEERSTAGSTFDEDRVFAALKSNPEFCRKFVTRFLDLANSRFSVKEAIGILEKYGYNSDWMDSFLVYRLDYMAPALAKSFGLKGRLTDLCIQLKDPAMGRVKVNTIEPDMTDGMWEGRYYTDYPEDLLAIPEEGYEFVCWKNEKSGRIISTSEKLTVDWEARDFDKSENVVLDAVFQEVK